MTKIATFLQNLSLKLLKLASRNRSGMATFILSAPTTNQLKEAREHLRYWPYVKAFIPTDNTHIKVCIFIGRGITEKNWDYYEARSCELMNLCVQQYHASFVIAPEHPASWLKQYNSNGFLRPDDLLKPFCDFIDEINNH